MSPSIRFFGCMALVLVLLSGCKSKNNFQAFLRKVYFDGDVQQNINILSNFYDQQKELKPRKTGGWTVYPPLSSLGQTSSPQKSYEFTHHPVFGDNGRLNLSQGDDSTSSYIELNYIFHARESAVKQMGNIIQQFEQAGALKMEVGGGLTKLIQLSDPGNRKLYVVVYIEGLHENGGVGWNLYVRKFLRK